jgi:hypothetical protein
MPIVNLNVRLLNDGTVFYSYEAGGKRFDGSAVSWEAFTTWLTAKVQEGR